MNFKEWLIKESGHFRMRQPTNINVLYHGRSAMLKNVQMVDPRFEFMDIPQPKFEKDDPRSKMVQGRKFMGQFTFSLPLVDPDGQRVIRWIVVPRKGPQDMLGGSSPAYIASEPEGVRAPLDWADHANIMDDETLIKPTYGGNVAV